MEEFAEGGRLSPAKVKEFIPAGTLGIGVDDNIWIRKARKDGKTYWTEFLETWNFKRFSPQGYDLKLGIHFRAEAKLGEKYGYELKYGYTDFGGFILDIYDADTMLTVQKYETKDPDKFRDICIKARDTMMSNDPILKFEFSELVGKLTSAFVKGELRKEFTEEPPERPKPKFKIGDLVVRKGSAQVMKVIKPTYDDTKKTFDYDLEYVKEGTNNSLFENELEVYKPSENPEFKIGDIVRVINGVDRFYKVIDVVKRSGVFLVKVEALDDESIQSVYSQDELELSDDAPDSKFEIGDYVRVLDRGEVVTTYKKKFIEYRFLNPNIANGANNGDEGYVVGVFDDRMEKPRYVVKNQNEIGEISQEFIIDEKGLELITKSPQIGDNVLMNDMNFLYPSAPSIKEKLKFKNPNIISKSTDVFMSFGDIFIKGRDPYTFMPIYGIYSSLLEQEVLMGIKGFELQNSSKKDNLENTKIQVNNTEENKLIQEYAFSLGYFWLGVERNIIQEFDAYPAYMEFTSYAEIFAPTKKQFDRENKKEVTLEELGLISPKSIEATTEFLCNIDASKINSAYVGTFYAKNKERIEKLNSEFSCKILEALVYLSDYENCGGGVKLPIQEVVEEDDLLGAIRNLK